MFEQVPTLGARFDLDKVGTEQNCWQVFWRAVTPSRIAGSSLYEGSIHRGDYCIALQSSDPAIVEYVKNALIRCEEFSHVALSPPFIEGSEATGLALPRSGRVDSEGNLLGDDRRLMEQEALPVESSDPAVSLDVVDSASTLRMKPASPRTERLPEISSFHQLQVLLKERFVCHQPGYERDVWISPKELCDVVEEYAALLHIGLSVHNSERTENALRVRLFSALNSAQKPIELEGMYMFKSRHALTHFLQSFNASPKYADAIPDLAGILGRFQLHFTETTSKDADYTLEEVVAPDALWERFLAVREGFGDELNRAVESLRQRRLVESGTGSRTDVLRPDIRDEESVAPPVELAEHVLEDMRARREEERRLEQEEIERRRKEVEMEAAVQQKRRDEARCIFCGKPLGFSEKLKKVDRHKACWEYQPD